MELIAAGAGGVANQNKELGGSRNTFVAAVVQQMRAFLSQGDDHYLRIYNPAQFRVTKQVSGWNADNAAFVRLTPSEITAIFSDAALLVCQELGMTNHARLCLVYEEAHTLVPEWNSVAAEGGQGGHGKKRPSDPAGPEIRPRLPTHYAADRQCDKDHPQSV